MYPQQPGWGPGYQQPQQRPPSGVSTGQKIAIGAAVLIFVGAMVAANQPPSRVSVVTHPVAVAPVPIPAQRPSLPTVPDDSRFALNPPRPPSTPAGRQTLATWLNALRTSGELPVIPLYNATGARDERLSIPSPSRGEWVCDVVGLPYWLARLGILNDLRFAGFESFECHQAGAVYVVVNLATLETTTTVATGCERFYRWNPNDCTSARDMWASGELEVRGATLTVNERAATIRGLRGCSGDLIRQALGTSRTARGGCTAHGIETIQCDSQSGARTIDLNTACQCPTDVSSCQCDF